VKRKLFFSSIIPGLLAVFLTGLLFFFAFPPFNCWYLSWIAFLPLLLVVHDHPFSDALLGVAAGFFFHAVLLSWLFNVAGPFYLLLAVYLSFFWGIFFFLMACLPARGRIFIAPALWFFLEILQANLLTGFPWLPLGLSQAGNHFILPFASLAGVSGISTLVVMANFAVRYGWKKEGIISGLSAAIVLTVAVGFSLLSPPSPFTGQSLTVAVIQEDIPSSLHRPPERILAAHLSTTRSLLQTIRPDLVVWPESAFPDVLNENPFLVAYLQQFCEENRCALLLGGIESERNNYYNAAFLFHDGTVETCHKTHLVPYGEYLLGDRFPFIRNCYRKIAGYTPFLSPGERHPVFRIKNIPFSVLICFENIFSPIARECRASGAGALMVITNDSWFGRSLGPYQHFAHSILRAVETGSCVVQAALTGESGVVLPDGTVSQRITERGKTIFVKGSMITTIPIARAVTPYTELGDIPPAVVALFILGVLLCGKK